MGVTPGRVSQIEHGEVSTVEALASYIAALGGRLELIADIGGHLVKMPANPAARGEPKPALIRFQPAVVGQLDRIAIIRKPGRRASGRTPAELPVCSLACLKDHRHDTDERTSSHPPRAAVRSVAPRDWVIRASWCYCETGGARRCCSSRTIAPICPEARRPGPSGPDEFSPTGGRLRRAARTSAGMQWICQRISSSTASGLYGFA